MFPEIVHKGCFRNPSLGRCPLVTDLAGIDLLDIVDGKALHNPHRNAGKSHMHFNGTDCFQHFFTGMRIFHLLQRCGLPFLSLIV